jgi:hypothetical protein
MNLVCALFALFVCFAPSAAGHPSHTLPDDAGRTTHVFSADTAKIGDVYAGMTLTSLDYNLATNDVTARFSGEAVITGTYEHLPEDHEFFSGFTFEVDSASITQLPVLATDERDKKWLILKDDDENRLLPLFGNPKPGSKGKATIVIRDYSINHLHKEIADTAKLVKIIKMVPSETAKE